MTVRRLLSTSFFLLIFYAAVPVEGGIYKMMAEAMLHHMMSGWSDGWHDGGKGVTLGLKSKGMTAIIPVPLPIPVFTKDKGKEKVKYVPVPVPHGGKEDWW